MRTRLRHGLPLTFGVLLLLWIDHHFAVAHCFTALVAIVALAAWLEFAAMAFPGRRRWRAAGAPAVAALVGAAWCCLPAHNHLFHAAAVPAVLFLCTFACAIRWGAAAASLPDIALWFAGVIYTGYLPAFFLQLRNLEDGEALVLACFLVVKLGDTGAYFTGRLLGRHRLCAVSPKKTVEGMLGGLVFACAAAYGSERLLLPDLPYGAAAAIGGGLALGAIGQAGDLIESFLKRACGVKHSSIVFPELGGVLDVVDSLLFAGPALTICMISLS